MQVRSTRYVWIGVSRCGSVYTHTWLEIISHSRVIPKVRGSIRPKLRISLSQESTKVDLIVRPADLACHRALVVSWLLTPIYHIQIDQLQAAVIETARKKVYT